MPEADAQCQAGALLGSTVVSIAKNFDGGWIGVWGGCAGLRDGGVNSGVGGLNNQFIAPDSSVGDPAFRFGELYGSVGFPETRFPSQDIPIRWSRRPRGSLEVRFGDLENDIAVWRGMSRAGEIDSGGWKTESPVWTNESPAWRNCPVI